MDKVNPLRVYKVELPPLRIGSVNFYNGITAISQEENPSRAVFGALRHAAEEVGIARELIGNYVRLTIERLPGDITSYVSIADNKDIPNKNNKKRVDYSTTNDLSKFVDVTSKTVSTNTNEGYRVIVEVRHKSGRTTTYIRRAILEDSERKPLLGFIEGPIIHHNDVEGKLDLQEEGNNLANYLQESLKNNGLKVDRRNLELILSSA